MIGTEESVSSHLENIEKIESNKKMKKVRSKKLQRLSSRGKNFSPIEVTEASPNYMKATSSSHAKDSFQITQRLITNKTLTRVSTLKLKRSLTRKLTGRTEQKRKLKSSRSIKIATVKGPKSTTKLYSESINGSDDNMKSTSDAGNKSQRVITRRLSFRPVRISTKNTTCKSKNSSMEKGPQMSQSEELSLHKATCSSTLKDSHFPDHIDLPQDGSDSQGVSPVKVCRYSYCSLHGHRHGDVPPLRRFVSMRRRQLKTQNSTKKDGRSKQIGNSRKATQKTKTVHNEDDSDNSHFHSEKNLARESSVKSHDTPPSTVDECGTSWGEDEEKNNFRLNAEVLLGETSFPHLIDFEKYLGNFLAFKRYASPVIEEKNIECCSIATEKLNTDFEITEREGSDKNMAASAYKKNDEIATMESTSTDVVKFPVSDIGILEGEVTTGNKNMEPDYEILQKSFVTEEPKPDSITTGVAYGMQERDQKYIKKWHLMYKHAVLSNTDKCENKVPFVEKDNEGREEDVLAFNGGNDSCHNYSETDSDMDDEKKNVVELVQKAFDEILLPEAENLSYSDHSQSKGNDSDDLLLEKNEGKREERNTATFTESPKEAQKMENKPKSWSRLKKVILLKRFVKALDKVRNINPRRPRQLPIDANFDTEKVSLNCQTAAERKKSEEWMLDYALQKVISKLAPAQRQRVTLLIEAFETIKPFQDAENGPRSSSTVESQENPIQSLDVSSNHSKEEIDDEKDSVYSAKKTLLGKVSFSNDNTIEFLDKASDNPMPELCNPIVPAEIKSRCHEEAPTDEIVDEVPEDLVSDLKTKNPSIKSESPERDGETKNVIGDNSEQFSLAKSLIINGLVRSMKSNLVAPVAPPNQLDEPTRDKKYMIEKDQLKTSKALTSPVVESETQVEKHGNKGLWFMVYKHMVSDMDENNSKTLTDVVDEKDSKYEDNKTREISVSNESTTAINQDMHFKDRVAADSEFELRQIEAIKMVEEAIDSILPDRQPLPDYDTIPENSIPNDRTERMHSESLNRKEEKMESENGIAEEQKEESESKEGNKPNPKLSRSWSNLKKVILLRRFIKALEKVRKFNPRGPRYLPLEPDSEAEKVQLRHQDMLERKGTEEWMLDYALRQVVSKLTPARKRKVELLVEAFETVVPTLKK